MKPFAPRLFAAFAALMLAAFALGASAQDARSAASEPTLAQIYQAANSGNADRAGAMIDEVLKSHPNSAKAHYVKAEISARQGKVDIAKQELATAEKIAPGLPFVKADSVQALRNQLAGSTTANKPATTRKMGAAPSGQAPYNEPAAQRGGFPWGTALLVGAIVLIGIAVLRRRNAAMAASGYGGAYGNTSAAPYGQTGTGPMVPPNAGGVPPGYGPGYPQQPGMGSSIGRGLATGAAVGAGMVAAEALGRHMFGHDTGTAHAAGYDPNLSNAPSLDQIDEGMRRNLNTDMGGDNFGVDEGGGWDAGGGDIGGGGGDWDS
jgi:hypothetical protein